MALADSFIMVVLLQMFAKVNNKSHLTDSLPQETTYRKLLFQRWMMDGICLFCIHLGNQLASAKCW